MVTRLSDPNAENNVLSVEGRISHATYDALSPVYTEYNIGHYSQSFTLSNEIDQEGISGKIGDGMLTLKPPKTKDTSPRRIEIS